MFTANSDFLLRLALARIPIWIAKRISIGIQRAWASRRISAVAILSMFLAVVGVGTGSAPAYASTFSLTISDSATSNVTNTTPGVFTASANGAVLNAAELVAEFSEGGVTAVSVNATGLITVDANVISGSSVPLTLKSNSNIKVSPGVTIQTSNGAITLQSDADGSNSGGILLGLYGGTRVSLVSGGGSITLSGGADPSTGYAMASNDLLGNGGGQTKPSAGVAMYGSTINAGGGNIVIRGASVEAVSTRGVNLEGSGVATSTYSELSTSAGGTVTVMGLGSNSSNAGVQNPWGVNVNGLTVSTAAGDITMDGQSRFGLASENYRGWGIGSASFSSTSGDISILDSSLRFADFAGSYLNSQVSFSTAGDVTIASDEIVIEAANSNLTFSTPSAVIQSYRSTDFTATLTISGTVNALNAGELVIGRSGNTSTVNLNTAISVGGPTTVYGSTIAVNKALSALGSAIHLHASTAVTQAEQITADKLALYGSGSFTLQNSLNNVATLAGGSAGSRLGTVKYTDASGGLEIGAVNPTGLYSSGDIEIATLAGDVSITQPVRSYKASGDTVLIYADRNEAAGSAGDGDVRVSGLGAVTVESGARALLYSGPRSTNSGLVSFVGGSSNTWVPVGRLTDLATLSPSISATGTYALFRVDIAPAGGGSGSGGNDRTSATAGTELAPTGVDGAATMLILMSLLALLAGGLLVHGKRRKTFLLGRE